MRLMTKSILLFLVSLAGSFWSLDTVHGSDTFPVSMVQLVAAPTEWDGRTVAVFGYLEVGLEPMLFLSREHEAGRDWSSAFSVQRPDDGHLFDGCRGHYVTVVARFLRPSKHDDYGLYDVLSMTFREPGKSEAIECYSQKPK